MHFIDEFYRFGASFGSLKTIQFFRYPVFTIYLSIVAAIRNFILSKSTSSRMFGVTILGNNSAIPAYDRHPTSQVVTLNDQLFLIDCGEGAQMQVAKFRIRRSKIHHIYYFTPPWRSLFWVDRIINKYGIIGKGARVEPLWTARAQYHYPISS